MTYYETGPAVIDGTPWRIAVVDSRNVAGQRTLEPRFFGGGVWRSGSIGAELNESGPYGLPVALAPLYRKNRFQIEAALQRHAAPQATLSILADIDREERAKVTARMAQAAIDRAGRAQALADLDSVSAIAHGAGDDLPLFATA